MASTRVAAGTRVRDRVGVGNPWAVFTVLGVVLVGAGVAFEPYRDLLFAWGGTALFVALFLRLVAGQSTVPGIVASEIHAAMAGNQSDIDGDRSRSNRYVPVDGAVRLEPGLVPVGEGLLGAVDGGQIDGIPADGDHAMAAADRTATLLDVLVHGLELADSATATVEEGEATGTGEARTEEAETDGAETESGQTEGAVTDTAATDDAGGEHAESVVEARIVRPRIATRELHDHPIASVLAVGLARAVDEPVRADVAADDDVLLVTCRWGSTASGDGGPSERGDDPVDGPERDEREKDPAAGQ